MFYLCFNPQRKTLMNWTAAIDRNRAALLRLVAMLLAAVNGSAMLPRRVHRSLQQVARPAEAALRRLVMLAAMGMQVAARAKGKALTHAIPKGTGAHLPVFGLFDPRLRVGMPPPKRYTKHAPRITIIGWDERVFEAPKPEPTPDDPMETARLCRRLAAMKRTLDDLPRAAKRLVRMQMRQEQAGKPVLRPMRPGRPPGFRRKPRHEVDEILSDCQELALMSLAPPDTG